MGSDWSEGWSGVSESLGILWKLGGGFQWGLVGCLLGIRSRPRDASCDGSAGGGASSCVESLAGRLVAPDDRGWGLVAGLVASCGVSESLGITGTCPP
jgi:hypothetical protein